MRSAAPPVAIVTDSTSDLDARAAQSLGVTVVPLFVNFGSRRFLDRVDLDLDGFHELLARGPELPTTTQPTAQMFEDAFAPLVAAGRPIVGIFISLKLSGTINAARAAADQFPGAHIELIDSFSATAGLGMQVTHAAELAMQGADVSTILAALARDRTAQQGYAALPDLSHLVRTGRIGKARGALGTLLRIVPVLRLADGEIGESGRVRTFARAQTALVDATVGGLGDVRAARLQVMHSHAPDAAQALLAQLRERLPAEPHSLGIAEVGPAIAVHVGPGAVGIFSIAG